MSEPVTENKGSRFHLLALFCGVCFYLSDVVITFQSFDLSELANHLWGKLLLIPLVYVYLRIVPDILLRNHAKYSSYGKQLYGKFHAVVRFNAAISIGTTLFFNVLLGMLGG